ncbi:aminoacyl-tRNA hydrolase [Basilea psittacipulmonis]|uniref:Peptidyl-tRNA hydrolase n=1 Tax=Basilea psittacipulmonis DSM 24701 TaxID=1072685 RepID=A0A077DC64_9BURK|nr:aminoacyl-tRNA hydrolase [Basilea psittacipulmonis]AIL32475.1 peptidyl-tRNA hydrolase [Basilea psittacipulmonis DSM 24701]
MSIKLIVGLGNPGKQYEKTRHNAGFWLLDDVANHLGVSFKLESGFFGEVAKVMIQSHPVFLLKPTTFMNRSGQSVRALSQFYKISPEAILVVHDELDLPPGEVKLKKGGGHAGHNGLKDIQAQLGTPNFWRLRLGIGHPRTLGMAQQVFDYVLSPPRKEDQNEIQAMIDKSYWAIEKIVLEQFDEANRILREK